MNSVSVSQSFNLYSGDWSISWDLVVTILVSFFITIAVLWFMDRQYYNKPIGKLLLKMRVKTNLITVGEEAKIGYKRATVYLQNVDEARGYVNLLFRGVMGFEYKVKTEGGGDTFFMFNKPLNALKHNKLQPAPAILKVVGYEEAEVFELGWVCKAQRVVTIVPEYCNCGAPPDYLTEAGLYCAKCWGSILKEYYEVKKPKDKEVKFIELTKLYERVWVDEKSGSRISFAPFEDLTILDGEVEKTYHRADFLSPSYLDILSFESEFTE